MDQGEKNFFLIPDWTGISFLVHGFGNRSWKTADFKAHPVWRNFKFVFLRQIHSDIFHVVNDVPSERLTGDALITDKPGLMLIIKTADCLPVLIVSRKKKAVAAVHCGWKSTSQRLVQKVIQGLERQFHCDPASLLVAFGPVIGRDCYEIGEDVRQDFDAAKLDGSAFLPHPVRADKYCLDLRLANKNQLLECGVKDRHMASVDLCTHCEDFLLSYRRSRRVKGRMLNFIGILPGQTDEG